MAANQYTGVEGVARKVKAQYIGVNGVARKVKNGFVGVNGVARRCFAGAEPVTVSGNVSQPGAKVPYGRTVPVWSRVSGKVDPCFDLEVYSGGTVIAYVTFSGPFNVNASGSSCDINIKNACELSSTAAADSAKDLYITAATLSLSFSNDGFSGSVEVCVTYGDNERYARGSLADASSVGYNLTFTP